MDQRLERMKEQVRAGEQRRWRQASAPDVRAECDAQAYPAEQRNFFVRVWGWSGYFTDLAPESQEHVIRRQMYSST